MTNVPMGTILTYALNPQNLPEGWLLCDGSKIDIRYQELITALGTDRTPDLRNRFIVGAGQKYSVKEVGGQDEVTLTAAQLPAHTHQIEFGWAEGGGKYWKDITTDHPGGSRQKMTTDGGNCSNQSHENRPPYFALYYIIKATNK